MLGRHPLIVLGVATMLGLAFLPAVGLVCFGALMLDIGVYTRRVWVAFRGPGAGANDHIGQLTGEQRDVLLAWLDHDQPRRSAS
jgi:hypothetical protein